MHLMIDLETLGTNPDCVVTQLGWALFNPRPSITENIIINSGCIFFDPREQIKRNRTITWETFAWWLQQDKEAQILMATSEDLYNFIEGSKYFEACIEDFNKIEGV